MRVLLIGCSAGAHALAKALALNRNTMLYACMEYMNHGIAELCVDYQLGSVRNFEAMEHFAGKHQVEILVVNSEAALQNGIWHHFYEKGVILIGSSSLCSSLSADHGFLRRLMRKNQVDGCPDFGIFYEKNEAIGYLRNAKTPLLIKPTGILADACKQFPGKEWMDTAGMVKYVEEIFSNCDDMTPGVIIEEIPRGNFFSLQIITDGKVIIPFPAVGLKCEKAAEGSDFCGGWTEPNHLLPFLDHYGYDKSLEILRRIIHGLKEQYSENFKGILSGRFVAGPDGIVLTEIKTNGSDPEIINALAVLQTDFSIICKAIAEEKLAELQLEFHTLATSSWYLVPRMDLETPDQQKVVVDLQGLQKSGVQLLQSPVFLNDQFPQPIFVVVARGISHEEANEKCLEGISCISGKGLYYQKVSLEEPSRQES